MCFELRNTVSITRLPPLIEPLPVTLGVWFDEDFSHHEVFDEAKSKRDSSWVVNTGEAQVQMWNALLAGMFLGWGWLDPAMGILGAILVAIWAKGLIIETSKVLLDREMDHPVVDEIREVVETGPDAGETRITDLHVWRVGKNVYACAITVLTHDLALTSDAIRQRLAVHEELVHSTIEIQVCPDVMPQPDGATA